MAEAKTAKSAVIDPETPRLTKTWLIATVLTVVSGLLWSWIFSRSQWEFPEPPRVQGEALELIGDRLARHRPEALAASVREFQNTWSSLAYVLVGLAITLRALSFNGRLLGLALVGLGWGCGIYHASIMPAWRLYDIIGMYWVTYALIIYGLVGLVWRRPVQAWADNLLGLSVACAAIATAVHRNDWRPLGVKIFDSTYVAVWGFFVVGLLIVVSMWLASPTAKRRTVAWSLGALAGIGLAATCQLGDRVGNFLFAPKALVQAHAVWHLFTATVVEMAYEIFRGNWRDPSLFGQNEGSI